MPKSLIPLAICYDFNGTLAPGNMHERDFIPDIGMKKVSFWREVKALAKEHEGDEILMYMRVMLEKAEAARVEVRRRNFMDYGKKLQLFKGAVDALIYSEQILSLCRVVEGQRRPLCYTMMVIEE